MKSARAFYIFALFLFSHFPATASEKPLIIQTEAWPPLVMQNSLGKPTGHDFEIMSAVLNQLGIEYEFSFAPWKRVIAQLKNKSIDAVLGIISTTERESFLFFPAEPISTGGYVLFFKKGMPFHYDNLNSLTGKKVGTVGGYKYGEDFSTASNFEKDSISAEGALTSNFRKLLLDRVDLVIANKNVGIHTASQLGILHKVGYTPNYITGESRFHLAFSQTDNNKKIARQFSNALKNFKKTPTYKEILERYGLLN